MMGIAKRVRHIIGDYYQLECGQCGKLEYLHIKETDNHGWEFIDNGENGNYWLCPDCQLSPTNGEGK
jgi:hypothetical protein